MLLALPQKAMKAYDAWESLTFVNSGAPQEARTRRWVASAARNIPPVQRGKSGSPTMTAKLTPRYSLLWVPNTMLWVETKIVTVHGYFERIGQSTQC